MERSRLLEGKTAVVTGAASGIGAAIARRFAREGASVALVDVNQREGSRVAEGILDDGGRAVFIHADATRTADCERAVREAGSLGSLDVLCNSAGVIRRATVVDTTEEEWDRVMAVNVKAVFLMTKHVIPVMSAGGGGAIVNIASGWGLVGGRRAAAYCASKGAVVSLTKAMALDHAAQHIRVNCICPGDTDTPMLRAEAEQLGVPAERFLAEAARRPLPRLGRPEDMADAALYLASDASAFVTGIALVVDGGALAGSA